MNPPMNLWIGITVVFVGACAVGCYSPSSFRGDGEVVCPAEPIQIEYILTLGEFPLNRDGEYEFRFSHAPPGDMVTCLASADPRMVKSMSYGRGSIRVHVIDRQGAILDIVGGDVSEEWTLDPVSSPTEWSDICFVRRLRPGRHCIVTEDRDVPRGWVRFGGGEYVVRVYVREMSETEPPLMARVRFFNVDKRSGWP
jgi:hypothetical protein